jgi:hypothetical protein
VSFLVIVFTLLSICIFVSCCRLSMPFHSLQQKVSLYASWFHWVLSEFISCSEWGPVKKQWIHWST